MNYEAAHPDCADDELRAHINLIELYGERLGFFGDLVPTLFGSERRREYDMATVLTLERLEKEPNEVTLLNNSFNTFDEITQAKLLKAIQVAQEDNTDIVQWFSLNGAAPNIRNNIWRRTKEYYCERRTRDPKLQQMTISQTQLKEAHQRIQPNYKPYFAIRTGLSIAVIEEYMEYLLMTPPPLGQIPVEVETK